MPEIDVAEIMDHLAGPSRSQSPSGPGKVETANEERVRLNGYVRFLEACPQDMTASEMLEAFQDYRL